MNEQSVGFLATLLKSEPSVIEKALSEGGLDSIIKTYQDSVEIFTPDELARKLENYASDTIANLGKDGKELPSSVYNIAKGNAFEAKEKKWAKAHGVSDFKDLDDLLEKIVNKTLVESGKATDEKDARINELKKLVKDTDAKLEARETELRGDFNKEIIRRDLDLVISEILIDGDDDEFVSNQKKILTTMTNTHHKFEYKDGKVVTSDENGELMVDRTGDPLSLKEVVNGYAPKWVKVKSVSDGGRGGSSTEQGNKGLSAIKSRDDIPAYLEAKGINPASAEGLAVFMEYDGVT